MGFSPCVDTAVARWIVQSQASEDHVMHFGPPVFEAYARLRYIPDPTSPIEAEADVELPDDHPPDVVQARRALHRLARFTSTADQCYFCIWEGYSDIDLPREVTNNSLVVLPHRRYALFQGALSSIDTFEQYFGRGANIAPPAFVWPADRRWCFASDVDPH